LSEWELGVKKSKALSSLELVEIFQRNVRICKNFGTNVVGYESECSSRSPQDRANADKNQISDCNYYRQLNDQHGDAEENLDDAQGDAGCG